jgi:hypothetical protein
MRRLRFQWIILVASVSLSAAATLPKWIQVEGGTWKHEPNVLSVVQLALKSALPTAYGGRLRKWGAYTFQYQGNTSVLGDRFVFVNAFCDSSRNDDQMRTEWVEVFDGGTCYFRVEYDVNTKRLRKLLVNGEA